MASKDLRWEHGFHWGIILESYQEGSPSLGCRISKYRNRKTARMPPAPARLEGR